MSCQQVPPRISEDPYAFTDAPTTIFNTQRNKLTSLPKSKLIINTNKANIVDNKIVNITNQQTNKIVGSSVLTQKDNLAKLKILNNVTLQQQEPKLNLTKTSSPIIVNGNKTIFSKSATVIVNNNNNNCSNNNVNRNIAVTAVETIPTKNVGVIKTTLEMQHRPQQQSHQLTKFANCNVKLISPSNSTTNVITSRKILPTMPPTQPQLVTLHQSHPLYSLTKQTPILTAPPVPLKSLQPPSSSSISNSTTITTTTILSNQNPPCQQQSQLISSQNLNSKLAIQPKPLTFQQQYILQQQQRINGNNNITNFENLHPNHSINAKVENSIKAVPQQQEQQVSYQISSLPLPQSNFAQPQQIKQLSSGPSLTVINKNSKITNLINNNKNTQNSQTKFTGENLENIIQTSVIVQNNKSPPPLVLNTHTKASTTPNATSDTICEKAFVLPQQNYNSLLPPSKRNSRCFSTGSTSITTKMKSTKNNITSTKGLRRAVENIHRISGTNLNLQQSCNKKSSTEWHAPESYVFDCLGPFAMVSSNFPRTRVKKMNNIINFQYSTKCDTTSDDTKPPRCIQEQSLRIEDICNSIPSWAQDREKRIELRKSELRRKATQLRFAQKYWTPKISKRTLQTVMKLEKFHAQHDDLKSDLNICCLCKGRTVPLTSYCQNHIIHDEEQKLFLPCTAHLGMEQCKRPVFDLIHTHPLCDQHSATQSSIIRQISEFQELNSSTKLDDMVPGKKRTKSRTSSMPIGRPKAKKIKRKLLTTADSGLGLDLIDNNTIKIENSQLQQHHSSVIRNFGVIVSPRKQQEQSSFLSQTNRNNIIGLSTGGYDRDKSIIKMNEFQQSFNNRTTKPKLAMYSKSNVIHQHSSIQNSNGAPSITQDILNMCENSSTYESSEDTGVGGLSESELIIGANDVIEEIPLEENRLLEEHDITNVLNQLPVDAFNDILFTNVPQNVNLEPSNHDEKEDLARAIERAVVSSLHQMSSGDQLETNFLESFLDGNEEILVDENDDIINEEICTTEVILQSNDNCNSMGSNALNIDGCSNSIDEMGSVSNSGNSNSSSSNLVTNSTSTSNKLLITGTDMRNLVQT